MITNRDQEREYLKLKADMESIIIHLLIHGTITAKEFDKIVRTDGK